MMFLEKYIVLIKDLM